MLGVTLAIAFTLPFVAETVQYLVPQMARVCDIEDLADNLAGLVIGVCVGLALRAWRGRSQTGAVRA